jgi:hypothetical protein
MVTMGAYWHPWRSDCRMKNAVLLAGFQAEGTRGRALQEAEGPAFIQAGFR